MMTLDDDQIAYLPTPADIRQACESIRETWGPGEERRRRQWSIPPPVELGELQVEEVE